jgi:hypothetical protein
VGELMKICQEFGYTDEALRQFVKDEQVWERNERHSWLQAEKEKLKLEASRLEAEKEKFELEANKLEA